MKGLRILVLGASAAVAIGLSACGGASQSGGSGASGNGGSASCPGIAGVSIGTTGVLVSATDQLTFSPASVKAKLGQVIKWTNTGTVAHTITLQANCLTDSEVQPGATWEVKFTQPGMYSYRCDYHPGMVGTVTVT